MATDARPFVPDTTNLDELRVTAAHCQGCGLYHDATQTVFGAGPRDARVLMVGEQPGDQEDRAGEPFVGPAGGILDKALREAGVPRAEIYVTNAVKHFKFKRAERGKRRIHQTPSRTEVVACRPWLLAELRGRAGTVGAAGIRGRQGIAWPVLQADRASRRAAEAP